jgi:hypothetical protein
MGKILTNIAIMKFRTEFPFRRRKVETIEELLLVLNSCQFPHPKIIKLHRPTCVMDGKTKTFVL